MEAGRLSVVALVRPAVTNSMRDRSKSVVRPWEALNCFIEVLDWEGTLGNLLIEVFKRRDRGARILVFLLRQ